MFLIPQDKANHFVYGAAIGVVSHVLTLGTSVAPFASIVASVAVGAIKEAHDAYVNYKTTGDWRTGPHGVEFLDFVATALGGVAVALGGL